MPRTQALLRTHTHLGPGSGRFTRKRVSCHAQAPIQGGVRLNPLWQTPLHARLARPWPEHAAPHSSPLFALRPRSTWVSKPANGSPGREAQRGGAPGPACAQGSPVRCGCARCRQARPAAVVCARTHTSTRVQRCLRSAHTQLAQLPYPPAPPPTRPPFVTCDLSFQRSFGQLKIVNRPTPQTSALFSGPHGLSRSLGTS